MRHSPAITMILIKSCCWPSRTFLILIFLLTAFHRKIKKLIPCFKQGEQTPASEASEEILGFVACPCLFYWLTFRLVVIALCGWSVIFLPHSFFRFSEAFSCFCDIPRRAGPSYRPEVDSGIEGFGHNWYLGKSISVSLEMLCGIHNLREANCLDNHDCPGGGATYLGPR